jgi:hypothetical protein
VVFSGIPVSSTNKTECHDIAEILWKVALNTINLNLNLNLHWEGLFIKEREVNLLPKKQDEFLPTLCLLASINLAY